MPTEVFQKIKNKGDHHNPDGKAKWRLFCSPNFLVYMKPGDMLPKQAGDEKQRVIESGKLAQVGGHAHR